MLSISGQLDERRYGAGTRDEASKRRSIYFTIKRSALIPFLTTFDFPEPLQSVDIRPTTTIAPQALALLNNKQARVWAEGFASRLASAKDNAAKVVMAWRLALGRQPSEQETQDALDFLALQTQEQGGNQRAALIDFAQVVMCLNDVIYVH
jgi:hypothetical protein